VKATILFYVQVLCITLQFPSAFLRADPVPVRRREGLLHGFLILRDLDNTILASGEVSQVGHGDLVTSVLVFHFKDGSIHEETAVFTQRTSIQLSTYHLVQRGKSFRRSTDLTVNVRTGKVTVISQDEKGKEESINTYLKLPNDLANGLTKVLLDNVDPKTAKTTVSMLVATPKPRIVKLEITPESGGSFSVAGVSHEAQGFVVKIRIGGISGVVAPVVGKQPSDIHAWMIGGKAPSLLKFEAQLYEGGPIWRIEMASPVWAQNELMHKK